MIIKYLKELLYDNECVVIAGFGAFITQRHSAVIDYTNNRFTPPYKEIAFNNKLVADDGLLVDFICKKELVAPSEANEKIQNFVNQTMAILEVNSFVEFDDFGKITVDYKGDYIFSLKEDLNLLSDSFGMETFNCNAIYRTETYHEIKEKITIEQKQKNTEYSVAIDSVEESKNETETVKRPSLFKSLAYTTLAFLLIFLINWTTDKTDSNLASWNPFLYSSPNEFFINLLSNQEVENPVSEEVEVSTIKVDEVAVDVEVAVDEISVDDEAVINEEAETIVAVETPDLSLPTPEIPSPEIPSPYYIIGGSFQTEASADKCLNAIKKLGFDKADVLEKNNKGYIRVYYESFAEKQEALVRLDMIRREYNESAWLLFQK